MKAFKQGAEIKLQKDDLCDLLTDALNDKLFRLGMDNHEVVSLSLHPKNKYVVRLEVKPVTRKLTNDQD